MSRGGFLCIYWGDMKMWWACVYHVLDEEICFICRYWRGLGGDRRVWRILFSHHAHRQSGGRSRHEWAGSSSSTSAPHETSPKPITSRIGRGGRIGQEGTHLGLLLGQGTRQGPYICQTICVFHLEGGGASDGPLKRFFVKGMNDVGKMWIWWKYV